MKHYVSGKAVCPFYKHEHTQVIYCNGIQTNSTIHIAFANPSEALEYKREHCRSYEGCKSCKVYQMLEGAEAENEKNQDMRKDLENN